jgi:hypothetical protein
LRDDEYLDDPQLIMKHTLIPDGRVQAEFRISDRVRRIALAGEEPCPLKHGYQLRICL